MSEKHLPSSPEKNTAHESLREKHEHHNKLKEHHEKARTAEHEHKKNLEAIQETVESTAKSSKESGFTSEVTPRTNEPFILGSELRTLSFNRTMLGVRKHLRPAERKLSRIVHQPAIETTSDIAAKTVFRPTGIIFGSICMLLGSVILLWMSKRYGFSYNYLLGLLLLGAGYIVGCVIEFLLFVTRRTLNR